MWPFKRKKVYFVSVSAYVSSTITQHVSFKLTTTVGTDRILETAHSEIKVVFAELNINADVTYSINALNRL